MMDGSTMNSSTTNGSTKGEVYPLNRDAAETKRLNLQHGLFFTYCGQPLINPSIALDGLEAIADIATGTGIWLKDVSKTLANTPTKTGNERSYDGFDISPDQFPSTQQKGTSFHVNDVLQPFLVELHGKYDLVHVRLVVTALPEDKIKIAVENLIPLIKPGGYVQWDDIRWNFGYNREVPVELQIAEDGITEFRARFGLSKNLPGVVAELFREAGLKISTVHEYPPPDTEEKIAAARDIRLEGGTVMGAIYQRLGWAASEAEAVKLSERDIKIFEKYFAEGWYPTIPIVTVVARKA